MPLLYTRSIRSFINAVNSTITIVVPHFSINVDNMNNTLLLAPVDNTTINISFSRIAIIYTIVSLCLGIRHVAIRSSNRFNFLEMFLVVTTINNARFTRFAMNDDELIRLILISFFIVDRALLRLDANILVVFVAIAPSFSIFYFYFLFFFLFDLVLFFFCSR